MNSDDRANETVPDEKISGGDHHLYCVFHSMPSVSKHEGSGKPEPNLSPNPDIKHASQQS
jgi:hypothetical protein